MSAFQLHTLDLSDGGISLLVRIPGQVPAVEALGPEHITTDVYFPISELEDYGDKYRKAVVSIAQLFAQSIAVPHLHHYAQRCAASSSLLLRETTSPPVRVESIANPELIPPPVACGVSYFRILGRESGTLKPLLRTIEARNRQEQCAAQEDTTDKSDTAHINHALRGRPPTTTPSAIQEGLQVQTGCFDRDFSLFGQQSDQFGTISVIRPTVILSIGSRTDSALEEHDVPDVLIPDLWEMVRTTRHTKWVRVLEGGRWGLSNIVAEDISNAMFADLNLKAKSVYCFI